MEGKTHIVGGLAAGIIYITAAGDVAHEGLFFASCIAGALLPDICHPNSIIGRKLSFLSFLVNKTFGHRTFTHSLIFMLMLTLLFMYTSFPGDMEWGILVGVFSHLLLDALTKEGIQLLWPLHIRVRAPFHIKTGGMLEHGFLAVLTLLIAYYGYQFYF
ncbi:metal-dependent hydrolase [Fictibacillus sp. Mic-4]|uniref:metal-dependent hydrolase n=1 Tax=Fictibacillus TaxID=1329200 RepID=UPI0004012F1F|nr:metal-dependent hydrolase [Fictibacillus gelatini]